MAVEWNTWNLYREIAWYGAFSAVTTAFASVFILRLGGSDTLVGLLTSLPALINVLWQIPAARFIERQHSLRRIILTSAFFQRLPALLIAMVPALLTRSRAAAVVWLMALGTVPSALCNVAFTTMLADVIPHRDRARVVSVRHVVLAAVTTCTVMAVGKALDILRFPTGYQLVFTMAFATSLVSIYYLGRIVVPERVPLRRSGRKGKGHRPDPRRAVKAILAQRDFVKFALASFLYHWGLNLAVPLYAIYRVRVLDISEGWIGVLSMVSSAITIVAYYAWGRVAEKRGWRLVLVLGALGACCYPIGTALSRHVGSLLVVAAVGGVASPAFNLGLLNGLLEVAPASRRVTYLAVFNTLVHITGFVSPLLGTMLTGRLGIRTVLVIASAVRVVGFLAYLRLLFGSLDPRKAFSAGSGQQ